MSDETEIKRVIIDRKNRTVTTIYPTLAMTLPKLSTMTEAEINETAAKLVGWKRWQDEAALIGPGARPQGRYVTAWIWTPPHDHHVRSAIGKPPAYLHDERAAITLCKGHQVVTAHHRESDTWTASFIEDEDTSWTSPPSPSLATAITHAFCIANNLAEL